MNNDKIQPMVTKDCKFRTPCGWCERQNKQCTQISSVTSITVDKLNDVDIHQLQKSLQEYGLASDTHSFIPYPCRACSNHPSNGGSGICNCVLPYMYDNTGTSISTSVTSDPNSTTTTAWNMSKATPTPNIQTQAPCEN